MIEFPAVELAEWDNPKFYGIYMDGKFTNKELVDELVKLMPFKVTLPCGNFRWFSSLPVQVLHDIACNCDAPYEHYFIKWKKRRRR